MIQNALFGKLSDYQYCGTEFLEEFLDRYVNKHVNKIWLMFQLSNLYVLIGRKSSDNIVMESEKKWVEIMPPDEYQYMEKNKRYILGYILIRGESKGNKKNHYIDLIDTRLKGHNLAHHMIEQYERSMLNNNGLLLPYEIIESSKNYWKNYFSMLDIESTEELDDFIKREQLECDNVKWEHLKKALSIEEDES